VLILVQAPALAIAQDLPVVVGTWAVAGFETAVDEAFEAMAGGRGSPMDAIIAGYVRPTWPWQAVAWQS
jgi:hypothetical protein